jgi:hypothetical protein
VINLFDDVGSSNIRDISPVSGEKTKAVNFSYQKIDAVPAVIDGVLRSIPWCSMEKSGVIGVIEAEVLLFNISS